MKYWRGYLTAAIFTAITWVLAQLGARFTTLVDMIYPYVIRTLQDTLSAWSGSVDFCLWQVVAAAGAVVFLASIVIMILLKWNPIQWFGWVLAVCSAVFMLNTLVYGLNFYAGSIADDIRLESYDYSVADLASAAGYYRDMANDLSGQVQRDFNGDVSFDDLVELTQQAGNGFENLVYNRSYPVFAGSNQPVKTLGWADLLTARGISGITAGLTGEAAVNPEIPAVTMPFTICREMAHRKCIAVSGDDDFAAFLACQENEDVLFRYSGYFMAYRACYTALTSANTAEASAAAARVASGMNDLLRQDMQTVDDFYNGKSTSGSFSGRIYQAMTGSNRESTYGTACDLLVSWHIQEIILPNVIQEEAPFDPLDQNQVDLSGLVNSRQETPPETKPQTEEGVG